MIDQQGVGVYDEDKVIKILTEGVIHDLNGKTTPFIAYTLALEELDRLKKESDVRFIPDVEGFLESLLSDGDEDFDIRSILNQRRET